MVFDSFRCGKFGYKVFTFEEVLETDVGIQKLNSQEEVELLMQTNDKNDVTLSDSFEITEETNPDSSCVSRLTELGDQTTLHNSSGIPAANDQCDLDENKGLLYYDKILDDANNLVSFDDEYSLLGVLSQPEVFEKPVRKRKRATSVSPSQRTSKKKQISRRSPPATKEAA